MVKRQNPKRVRLPNGRTFYAKYKRTTRAELPANVHLQRAYRQELLQKGGEGEEEQLLDNGEEVSKVLSKRFLKKFSTLPKR